MSRSDTESATHPHQTGLADWTCLFEPRLVPGTGRGRSRRVEKTVGQLERERDDVLAVNDFAGLGEAVLRVERARAGVARDVAALQLRGGRPAAHVVDEEIERRLAVALPLVLGRDHETPQEVARRVWIVVEHHEADGLLPGIDGAEPRLRLKVRLRDRPGVVRDDLRLLRRDRERGDRDDRLPRDLPQGDLAHRSKSAAWPWPTPTHSVARP